MTNLCGSRFVPNYATLTHDLRGPTKKDVSWCWREKHDECLEPLKTVLSQSMTLTNLNPKLITKIYVDASPVGICAVLIQRDSSSNPSQVVHFASRALTPTEQRYSQTQSEALTVAWSCEHLCVCIRGTICDLHRLQAAHFNVLISESSAICPY